MTKTIRYNAPYIVAFKGEGHAILRDGCVVVRGNQIVHVGEDFDGHVDATENTRSVIAPGFISTHTHMNESPMDKGLAEDTDRRQFWSTNLIEVLPTRSGSMNLAATQACARFSVVEHIRTGTTTVTQMGDQSDYIADVCREVGLRAYISESYASGSWHTKDGKKVSYEWLDDDGFTGLKAGVDFVERHRNPAGDDLITGFLNPSTDDTCSEALLRASMEAAVDLDVPLQIHAAESLSAFLEMTRRYGRTPIEWLGDLGLLAPRTILGHGLFVAESAWTGFYGDDIGLIADSGAAVSYNPWVFGRNGIVMESHAMYLQRGVNVVLGTDSVTQSMLDSCRWASVLGKTVARRSSVVTAGETFTAATLGGAKALGRSDLGRIQAGAKADLVFWDADSMYMSPMRDPIRNIVYYAQHSDIQKVLIDGRTVLENGEISGVDYRELARDVHEQAEHMWSRWSGIDWKKRTVEEHLPSSFPEF